MLEFLPGVHESVRGRVASAHDLHLVEEQVTVAPTYLPTSVYLCTVRAVQR